MKFFALAVCAVWLLALSGCSGLQGCSGAIWTQGRAKYAGDYTATFTPATGDGGPIRFTFTLAENGQAQGAVAEAGGTTAKTVDGQVGDTRNGCDIEGTSASLDLREGDRSVGYLHATRSKRNSVVGTYGASLSFPAAPVSGTLTIDRMGG